MKLKLLSSILTLCFFGILSAQNYPVTVVPQAVSPSPIYFSSYADAGTVNSPLRVQLLLNDITLSNVEVRLKTYFEGNGIRFESNNAVVGANPIYLEGGVPVNLTNIQLAPFYSLQNISGINSNQYAQPIPEGSYQFCFEVYDAFTGNRLSARSCATTYIFKNEPPFLILPRRDETIDVKNPQNIVFQWTPRHINVSNVEYELSIVEIWDNYVDPQAAFFSMPPIFQATTRNTSYLLGPADPILLPNKKYAWRVQAKAISGTEEIGLFNNNGYSEIFWFTHSQPCEIPANVRHEVKGTHQANVEWDDFSTEIPEYKVRYREKNSSSQGDWFYSRSNTNWVTIWDLRPGTTYEYQVNRKCQLIESEYSPVKTFTTFLADDESGLYNCGISPEINITNADPLPDLFVNDVFKAGDFPIKVLEVSGSNGRFTGKGYVSMPYLKNIKVAVEFTNVLINTDKDLIEGMVITKYDPTWSNILDTDGVIDSAEDITDVFTGGDNTILDPVDYDIKSVTIKDGQIVVTGTNGEETTYDYDEGDTYQISGTNGVYAIDENGNVSQIGETAEGGPATAENTEGINTSGNGTVESPSVAQVYTEGATVIFRKGSETKYELDMVDNSFEQSTYPKAKRTDGKDYYPVHKAVVNGNKDVFYVDITITNNEINIDSLVFKTVETGLKLTNQKVDNDTYKIEVEGRNAYRNEEAIIAYKDASGKQVVIASFFIHHLHKLQTRKVQIVSVNGAPPIEGLEATLDTIFGVAGASFDVNNDIHEINISPSVWDIDEKNDVLDYNGSGLLPDYPKEIRAIHQYYMANTANYDTGAYYVFLVDKSIKVSKAINGFMPKGRQFGYIFNAYQNQGLGSKKSQDKVVAHELGHGVFSLEHPFESDSNAGNTQWLMDYNANGTQLPFTHWAVMSETGLNLQLFQPDEEGEYDPWEYVSGNDFLISKIPNTTDTDILSFVSTAGVIYSLSGRVRDISFINGFMNGFTIDGERYMAGKGTTSNNVKGYFADVKDNKSKKEDKLTKDLDYENLFVYYGYVNKNSSDCNAKNVIYKAKYIGEKISGINYGFTSSNEFSLINTENVHDENSKIIDFKSYEKYADVSDVFNCLKGDDLKFLYKYIEYKHSTSEISFLNDLFEKLNKFESVFIGGLTTNDKFNKETDELHYLNLDNYGDVTIFKDAINTFVKNNSEYSAKRLKVVLKDDQKDTIFPEGIAEFIPYYDSIFNCFSEEYGTLDIDGYYVPLCVWKDVNVSEAMYYSSTDPAFIAGVADGGIGLVVDLYKLALGLQKINLAYGLKLQDCSPNNEFLIGEYSKVLNRLKNINVNLSLDMMIVNAPPAADFVLLKTIIKYKKVIDAVKNKTDITDEDVKKIANILDKLQEFTPEKFKEWDELTNKIENKLVDISVFGNITCDEAQKIRDNTVHALEFIEKLSDPAEFETKKLIFNEIKTSLLEYKDKTLATDNVARHNHGKIVFEIAAEILIAVLTEGGGNIARGTSALMAKMGSLAGKMDNIVKLAIKKADNIAGILIKRNRVFTPNGRTLLMVADENGVYKLYKVLPDDAGNVKEIAGTRFDDVDIELPNGKRLDDTDIDIVEKDGNQYVRLLDESYSPDIKLRRLANNESTSVSIKWDNIDQTEIWFDKNKVKQTSPKLFVEEKSSSSSKKVDLVIDDHLYVKLDTDDGRILLGDKDGNYYAFGQIDPTEFNTIKPTLTDDAKLQEYLIEKAEQLQYLSGVKQRVLKGIRLSLTKVNTILGRFKPDVKNLFDELGSFKNIGLGETKGGINILNRPEGLANSGDWWLDHNMPWLDKAIKRGDEIHLATIPTKKGDLVSESGDLIGSYAKELNHLADNNYKPSNVSDQEWNDILGWLGKPVNGVGSLKYGKNFTSKLRSNTSLSVLEKSIAEESHQILNSTEFKKITDGFENKTPVQIEINGRTISYDDAPFSGMTWFEENGFNIGREAFVSEEELIKTVLHEMHRLKTSTLRGSGSAAQVSQETKAAFDYANKTFNLFE